MNTKKFVIQVLALEIKMNILIDLLKKILIQIKYLDYANIFLLKFVAKLLEHSNNNYIIKLEASKQPLYGLMYSLQLIKLEILKAYIKINLANSLIRLFKSPANISILFD